LTLSAYYETAPTDIYSLSLHDALPILRGWVFPTGLRAPLWLGRSRRGLGEIDRHRARALSGPARGLACMGRTDDTAQRRFRRREDRKSTRLNSSHVKISYAVFCLKKKK